LDPDIPSELQRVFFEASPHASALRFQLNGKPLAPAGAAFAWKPEPGPYELTLVDARGETLDSVTFHVRGSAPAPETEAEDPEPPSPEPEK
jgi:hypothetical protein